MFVFAVSMEGFERGMDLSGLHIENGVRRRLEAAVGRLSHAYIIEGPVKETNDALANHLAQAHVCSSKEKKPCGDCPNCRKAAGKIHPDITRVSLLEDKREIVVGQVRQLRSEAYIRPNEADRKVFIIEDAQAMNENAQNALLKVLEDGPQYLSFLLLTENAQQLLTTIRSRCETLSLMAGPEETVVQADEELYKTAEQLAALLLKGDELALAELTTALEVKKLDKDALQNLLNLVEQFLREQLSMQPREVLPIIEHLRRVRQAVPFNVGTGHILGWLASGK